MVGTKLASSSEGESEATRALAEIRSSGLRMRDLRSAVTGPSEQSRAQLRRLLEEPATSQSGVRPDLLELALPVIEDLDWHAVQRGIRLDGPLALDMRRQVLGDVTRAARQIETQLEGGARVAKLEVPSLGAVLTVSIADEGMVAPSGFFGREDREVYESGPIKSFVRDRLEQLGKSSFRFFFSTAITAWATWKTRNDKSGITFTRITPFRDPTISRTLWKVKDDTGTLISTDKPWRTTPRVLNDFANRNYFGFYHPVPGDNVIIVGGGIGGELLTLSPAVGVQGSIRVVEPHPITRKCLEHSCRLNGFDNVELIFDAVGAEAGTAFISDDDSYGVNTIMSESGAFEVNVRPLDDIVAEKHLNVIDYLQMNIEGAEGPALEGMAETIRRVKRACICCHDFRADRGDGESMRTKGKVMQFLRENGFEVFTAESHPLAFVRDHVYARAKGW